MRSELVSTFKPQSEGWQFDRSMGHLGCRPEAPGPLRRYTSFVEHSRRPIWLRQRLLRVNRLTDRPWSKVRVRLLCGMDHNDGESSEDHGGEPCKYDAAQSFYLQSAWSAMLDGCVVVGSGWSMFE